MMKNKRKVLSIILTLILAVVIMPNVGASSVKINGGNVDIYETGGEGSATFDKTTNTLTLNGYNNDTILFDGFDEQTINVILKGTNTITSGGYVSGVTTGLGFDYTSSAEEVTLNITGETGSKLNISGYYNGIYSYAGTLNISNADIEMSDIVYVGTYLYNGELLSVKNTTYKINGAQYGIANDGGDVSFDNLKYTATNITYDNFDVGDTLIVKNSNFDIETSNSFIDAETIEIYNTDFKINALGGFAEAGSIKISDSDFKINGLDGFAEAGSIKISDSDFEINELGGFAGAGEFEIKNSNFKIEEMGAFTEAGSLKISDSDFDIKSAEVFAEAEIFEIKNSKFNIEEIEAFTGGLGLLIDNSKFTLDKIESFIATYDVEINKSTIKLTNGVTTGQMLMMFNGKIKDSKVSVKTKGMALTADNSLVVDNSDVLLVSEDSIPLAVLSEEKVDFNDKITLKGVTVEDSKLIPAYTNTEVFEYAYGYFTKKPAEYYAFDQMEQLFSIVPNKVHFVTETLNPKTSDNSVLYVITLITSLLGALGLVKYLKH